jgi:hypothetical protein
VYLKLDAAGLGAVRAWTTASPRNLDADFFTAQCDPGGLGLQALAARQGFTQRLTRSTAAVFGTCLVDLVLPLGSIGQNQHLVARNLQEAAAHGHCLLGVTDLHADDARLQRCQQRGVARQDADDAFGARRDNHVDGFFGIHLSLGGDDLNAQRHA